MIEIIEVPLEDGKLVETKYRTAAADIILRHLEVNPEFLRTAPHTYDGVTEWFERKHLDSFWFAKRDDVIVGMVGLSRHPYDQNSVDSSLSAEICRLMVLPDARGQGVGKMLFDKALSACRSEGAWLTVLAGSDAEKMYRNWGWEHIGRVPSQDDPLDDVIAMYLPA